MAQQLQQQLKELGSKLETPPSSKDSLVKLFKQANTILSDLEQSPPTPILESMQPFLKAIVRPELLKHQDKDVKLLVASCLCEITRITAPEAPYSDEILKDIFCLIVGTFSGLSETNGPSFGRRVIILETLARYRSCVVMLDLECDDLISELFRTFFSVARDDHPENVLSSMKTIMHVLLDESEDIHEDLLLILLSTLGQNKKDVTVAGRKLAMNVIEHFSAKLEPYVKQFLMSSMTEESSLNSEIDYHEVIFNLYRCSPQILLGVVPYLTGEILNDQSKARLKAVNLVGELFALPGSAISEAFQSIFVEFLKRLTDREVEVRMSALDYVKRCLLSNPLRPEAAQIFAALCDRLLDYDENVRKQVVAVVCDVACYNLDSIPVETAKLVAERLRDKSLLVKKYTLDRLAEIYRHYCLRCKEGCANEYDWVPGKILRCFYDKDFRSDAIESILCGALFPAEFSVKNVVENWIRIFAGLDKVEVKALEKILEQKQRLQQEMQKYMSLKQTCKDADATDYQKKVILLFRVMSRFFVDPSKAEEGFLTLDQLKDANIWKILLSLLDPNTSFHQARASQDDLLKILGEKHPLFDFLNVLSVKCSFVLFSKEHVKEFLLELTIQKSTGNTENCLSCVNMLVILASYCPLLFIGSEEDLLNLLKDENEIVKEGILHVLARAGGTIREQLTSSSSSVDLILERLCLEGTRRQAKYAVHALAMITKDDGLRSLSVLYKKLVDLLDEKAHLPTVLQSLGCIAQTAMAVFETRESEIVEFIKIKILKCSNKGQDKPKTRWRDQSELCLLKIFGIKALVKSYLPVKDAHLRGGIDSLIEILRNMLSFGDFSEELESSSVDKAHLKLASAKAILRLSRSWENNIPADVFHLALRTVEINFRQARKLFLSKVHQYIKDRILDPKYACAFLLDIFASKHADIEEDKHNLGEVIQMCRQVKARQLSIQSDTNFLGLYPEYILPYLVHMLAHHPMCPIFDKGMDVKALEPVYRVLYLLLSMVLHGEEDIVPETISVDKEKDIFPAVVSILQCIKRSEDVVDKLKSKNSHAISELGLLVIKRLSKKSGEVQGGDESVSLPSVLYKPSDTKDEASAEAADVYTWVADDSVLAHFESLTLEVNGIIHIEIPQDEVLEDVETDGNEIPLGKLIKKIKSQKNKAKAMVKGHSSPTVTKNEDVLKVVREINLDNLGPSSKIEASNGHANRLTCKPKIEDENPSKKRKEVDAKTTSAPKRQRSSSARSRTKFPSSKTAAKPSANVSSKDPLSIKKERDSEESDLVTLPVKRKRSNKRKRRSKSSYQGNDIEGHKVEESDTSDQKRTEVVDNDKSEIVIYDKSSVGSVKKRKSRSVSGFAKCTSNEGDGPTTDLVDCRIKIWWPMDKRFYEGVVKSYDPEKKKHVVLYNDGDVEVLHLEKERWELVDGDHRPKKKTNTAKSPPVKTNTTKSPAKTNTTKGPAKTNTTKSPAKMMLPKKKNKTLDESRSRTSEKRPSSVKGKRSQKKTSRTDQRDSLEGKTASAAEDVENRSDYSDISNAEPTVSSASDVLESGDAEQDYDDVEEKSNTARKEVDGEAAQKDTENSDEEETPSPENGQKKAGETSQEDSHASDMEKSHEVDKNVEKPSGISQEEFDEGKQTEEAESNPMPDKTDTSDGDDTEDADDDTEDVDDDTEEADDVPLSTWKRRVAKSHQ
ncbi:sister chromatid cohesion protein PDS5 homolog A [Spinacia oleracea]|uniref:Sister chromatid cohesion protein PDS5 homolog A n=1 Tax=Spinacia oleracea TaxID=3562 RepID=A0A9R0K1R4_SPIOL|nr:sister chromatid cohesion protein PDS5 homolog A [Spinacia oleracea]